MSHKAKRWAAASVVLFVTTFVIAGRFTASAATSAHLDQCANLDTTCDTAHPSNWQNGNLHPGNSTYTEGQSVPFRALMSGLTPGQTYGVSIEWNITHGGHHAYDYITSLGYTESTADPCSPDTCPTPRSLLGIPVDPYMTAAGVAQASGQSIQIDGGSFVTAGSSVANTGNICATALCDIPSNPTPYAHSGDMANSAYSSTTVYFVASAQRAVLSWSGHVASQTDWGVGNSASDISGSPYHMQLSDFTCSDATNCSVGSEDRSMSTVAIVATTTTTEAPTTTTTEPPTTTTTEAPTTTTTEAPTTTSTLPPTSTTVTASTTTVTASTTTAGATTIPATTSTAPGTTVQATTTTSPSDLFVLIPTTTTPPGELVATFPSTLPSTGLGARNWLVIAAVLVVLGVAVLPVATRRGRLSSRRVHKFGEHSR